MGRIQSVQKGESQLASGSDKSWQVLLPLVDQANEIRDQIRHVEQDLIGSNKSRNRGHSTVTSLHRDGAEFGPIKKKGSSETISRSSGCLRRPYENSSKSL